MNRIILLLLAFLITNILSAQQVDTVVHKDAYTSYYSYTAKDPLYVVYHLYKGGGDCSRKGMNFVADVGTATNKDYKGNGYDKGHLADAEDFAYDCDLERSTFSYYNCYPQTPRLNRGIWKVWETKIRKESQALHLTIICGGIYSDTSMLGDAVYVPVYCWKMVIDDENGGILHCLICPNDNSDRYEEITVAELKKRLHYSLVY